MPSFVYAIIQFNAPHPPHPDVYSLGPLFLFLLVSLVVSLLVAWLTLLLTLLTQHRLSTLPTHLKSLFVKPCGAPAEEKPKVWMGLYTVYTNGLIFEIKGQSNEIFDLQFFSLI